MLGLLVCLLGLLLLVALLLWLLEPLLLGLLPVLLLGLLESLLDLPFALLAGPRRCLLSLLALLLATLLILWLLAPVAGLPAELSLLLGVLLLGLLGLLLLALLLLALLGLLVLLSMLVLVVFLLLVLLAFLVVLLLGVVFVLLLLVGVVVVLWHGCLEACLMSLSTGCTARSTRATVRLRGGSRHGLQVQGRPLAGGDEIRMPAEGTADESEKWGTAVAWCWDQL